MLVVRVESWSGQHARLLAVAGMEVTSAGAGRLELAVTGIDPATQIAAHLVNVSGGATLWELTRAAMDILVEGDALSEIDPHDDMLLFDLTQRLLSGKPGAHWTTPGDELAPLRSAGDYELRQALREPTAQEAPPAPSLPAVPLVIGEEWFLGLNVRADLPQPELGRLAQRISESLAAWMSGWNRVLSLEEEAAYLRFQ